jgi:hypothetical protein
MVAKAHCFCQKLHLDGAFLMIYGMSEMNYMKKRLWMPTNRYFQLHSTLEFGYMYSCVATRAGPIA